MRIPRPLKIASWLLRQLIVPPEQRPAPHPQVRQPPIDALLDGRECDRHAFEKLVGHVERLLGPLPAGRLLSVQCSANQVANWISVSINVGKNEVHIRREIGIEPKDIQMIVSWWVATGLEMEFFK